MKRDWNVTLDVFGPVSVELETGQAVESAAGRTGARFTITAPTPAEAIEAAESKLRSAIERTGVRDWKVVRAVADQAQAAGEGGLTNLVGVSELAKLLDVSRQRASELARSRQFPKPIAVLASTPVWLEDAVKQFASKWTRRSGRPRKPEAVHVAKTASGTAGKPAAKKASEKPAPKKPAAKRPASK